MQRHQRDNERKERTRQRLLDSAAKVFAKNGFHQTLIAEIVAEAQVGQGTFYRHFDDKRGVFSTLLDEFIERLFAEFSPMATQLPTNVDEYHRMSLGAMQRVVVLTEAKLPLVQLFLREGPSIDHEFEQRLEGIFDRFADLARYFLDYAIAQGFARPCDSRVVSQALVGMTLRLLKCGVAGPLAELPRAGILDEAVDFAFRGFGLYPAPAGRPADNAARKGD
jgi:AcrR family transcriptional regulator